MLTTATSTALLQGLRQGNDEQAWRHFCTRYEPVLLAFARRAGLRDADAHDLVQNTLVVFVERIRAGQYDRDRGRLRSWLRGIAFNKIREAQRGLVKREVQFVDDPNATASLNRVPDDRTLTDIFEQEWQRGVLTQCLEEVRQQVDGQTFEAFELYALRDWAPARVAEHLGISRNAVYISKSRVLSRVRQLRREVADIW